MATAALASSSKKEEVPTTMGKRPFRSLGPILGVASLVISLLAACAPAATPTPAPAKPAEAKPATAAPTTAAAAKPAESEAERVAMLVEGAKKEGTVTWLGSALEETAAVKAIEAAFKKKYGLPDSFKLSATRKSVGEMPPIIEQEIKANKVSYDIVNVSNFAWWLDLIKRNEVMAYESPEYKNYSLPEQSGFNYRPYFVSDAYTFIPTWNKRAMPNLQIKSYNDLLKPELKGKIVTSAAHVNVTALNAFLAMKIAMGDDFWQKLAKQEPVIIQSSAQRMDAVASGEYPVTTTGVPGDIWVQTQTKKVDYLAYAYPEEGVSFQALSTGILAKAPHPNAAKLFIDFFRSKEAQELWMKEEGYLSGRDGVVSPNPELLRAGTNLKIIKQDLRGQTVEQIKAASAEFEATFIKKK